MSELKPCPFCGHKAEMAEEMRVQGMGEKKWYKPICPECMCDLGYFDNMDEAVETWNRRQNMNEWISTHERLPKCEWGAEVGNIAYYCKNSGSVLCGCFGRGGKWRDQYFRTWNDAHEGIDVDDVSHWMPLPEPPEVEE